MRLCYNADSAAPRAGCGCGECARAREYSLDPRLLELARYNWQSSLGTSNHIIYQHIQRYLAGQVEWADLLINIIQSLATQHDAMFDRALKTAMLTPMQPVVVPSDPT